MNLPVLYKQLVFHLKKNYQSGGGEKGACFEIVTENKKKITMI
ncbi:hypothetical protein [Ectobacillus polymachus]